VQIRVTETPLRHPLRGLEEKMINPLVNPTSCILGDLRGKIGHFSMLAIMISMGYVG
jgi:hypothetical protein